MHLRAASSAPGAGWRFARASRAGPSWPYDRKKTPGGFSIDSLFAADALLPGGWARDVTLEWDEAGTLTRVEAGTQRGALPAAAGPVLPGMTNIHSHAFQRAMAGLAELRGHPTDDFWTWR